MVRHSRVWYWEISTVISYDVTVSVQRGYRIVLEVWSHHLGSACWRSRPNLGTYLPRYLGTMVDNLDVLWHVVVGEQDSIKLRAQTGVTCAK